MQRLVPGDKAGPGGQARDWGPAPALTAHSLSYDDRPSRWAGEIALACTLFQTL